MGASIEQAGGGYDHCYVVNRRRERELVLAAQVVEPRSGRRMEVYTTQPGIQLYTANGLNGTLKSHGHSLQKHAGLCLETQHFPDSPNQPQFPTTRLNPGEKFHELTVHRFRAE